MTPKQAENFLRQLPPWRPENRSPRPGEIEEYQQWTVPPALAEQARIVAELRPLGLDIQQLCELHSGAPGNKEAAPVVARLFLSCETLGAKLSLAGALGQPWAKEIAGPVLMSEFMTVPAELDELKWTIASALSNVADKRIVDSLLKVAVDRSNGIARQMLVLALGKTGDDRVVDVLIRLLSDQEVAGHAVMALGKMRVKKARSEIEKFLDHPKAWIRSEAKKSLKAIDKSGQ